MSDVFDDTMAAVMIASAMPGGDQSIFDCRRAGLVSPESRQGDYAWTL